MKTALFIITLFTISFSIPVNILSSGLRHKRINIVFLGDGYIQADSAKFISDSRWILESLMQSEPYKTYKAFFNASSIFRASAESGSDHPSTNTYKDTYYSSTYDTQGMARLVTLTGTGHSNVYSVLSAEAADYDIVIMIVNDLEYGGSGGFPAVTSVNSSSPEICIHELGHSFADLADEYETAYPSWVPRERTNSTQKTERTLIVWNSWINDTTPLPTPKTTQYSGLVGIFEGSQYQSTGWFRPKQNCKMRTLGTPFCEVCRENHIYTFYRNVSPIDTSAPAALQLLKFNLADTIKIDITTSNPSIPFDFKWYFSDSLLGSFSGSVLRLPVKNLRTGLDTLSVFVSDTTHYVKNTTKKVMLSRKIKWPIQINGGTDVEKERIPTHSVSFSVSPNPFNPTTRILALIPENLQARIEVFNILGEKVDEMKSDSRNLKSGLIWNADLYGTGSYLFLLSFDGKVRSTSKALFIK